MCNVGETSQSISSQAENLKDKFNQKIFKDFNTKIVILCENETNMHFLSVQMQDLELPNAGCILTMRF